ncbi:MAG TPA: phosphopantothenoylcysteine decarboxylase [Candidatus Thermoplasmatota archaeon]|nr:phosphopantothenoylcysteine decarboxylase [Candidatus Thermoplasmatota archaeon]
MQPLAGRRIVLGISGSIGAVQAPALAARLVALGAEVQAVATPAALRLVGPAALRDATGLEPVAQLTGRGEHVRELLPDGADLLLLAPCTANTLGKVALGLDDSPVTTFASVLLGHVPVVIAPAMHATMWDNAAVRLNLQRARDLGCVIVAPRLEEGAAKMAPLDDLEAHVLRALGAGTLAGRRVVVVAGPTSEPLGEGLWLSNRSTAGTGLALAREAFRQGADVELWLGAATPDAPAGCTLRRFTTVEELLALAPHAHGADAVLVPAAVGDYAAAGPRDASGRVPLRPTPKFVDVLREGFDGVLVCFKAESGLDDKALLAKARALQERTRAALVVANDLERVGRAATEALLVEPERATPFRGPRDELAAEVLRRVAGVLAPRDPPRIP